MVSRDSASQDSAYQGSVVGNPAGLDRSEVSHYFDGELDGGWVYGQIGFREDKDNHDGRPVVVPVDGMHLENSNGQLLPDQISLVGALSNKKARESGSRTSISQLDYL